MGNARLNARSVVMPDAYGNIPATQRYQPLVSSIDPKKLKASIDAAAAPSVPVQTGMDVATVSSAPKKEAIEEKPDYDTGEPVLKAAEVQKATSTLMPEIAKTAQTLGTLSQAGKIAAASKATTAALVPTTKLGMIGTAGFKGGEAAANAGAKVATVGSKGAMVGALASLGLAVAGTGLGMAGQAWENKSLKNRNLKGYAASQTMEWGGKGLSAGSTIGGFFGAPGALIGGAIGAGVGAIGGGVAGLIKKKKMLNERDEADKVVAEGNALAERNYKRNLGQWRDRQSSQALQMASAQYKKGGALTNKKRLKDVPVFAMGGTVQEFLDPNFLPEEQQKELMGLLQNDLLEHQQKGKSLDVNSISTIASKYNLDPKWLIELLNSQQESSQPQSQPKPIYKAGGKMKLKAKKCSCEDKPSPMMFRRGGSLDLEKSNVIIDGPSHGEYNNTGVKGDKGLPIVKNGHKIAEIESGELIINKKATEQIQDLRKAAIRGDKTAKEKLGKLLQEEIGKNTYDYTELLD
jgi:hypothetical protein